MSKIHFFQRYSTPENTITNNTLQLFARIYDYSPIHASRLLSQITDEEIEIGVEVNQQEKSGKSVPDGIILQRSFKIIFETKVNSKPNVNQLLKHASGFDSEERKVLILLTRQKVSKRNQETFSKKINAEYADITFASVTFEQICEVISDLFEDYQYEIKSIINDFIEYCNDVELFDQVKNLLRIVPCNKSIGLNEKYSIYYHPSDRSYTKHKFVGMYSKKTVHYILEVKSVFDVKFVDKNFTKELIEGKETDEYDDRIVNIIKDAKNILGHKINTGHRFFCGNLYQTNYQKSSKWGIQGARFVNLKDEIDQFKTGKEVANQLNGKYWQ